MSWIWLAVLLTLALLLGFLWVIIEWVWSDTPTRPRPWQRGGWPRSRKK